MRQSFDVQPVLCYFSLLSERFLFSSWLPQCICCLYQAAQEVEQCRDLKPLHTFHSLIFSLSLSPPLCISFPFTPLHFLNLQPWRSSTTSVIFCCTSPVFALVVKALWWQYQSAGLFAWLLNSNWRSSLGHYCSQYLRPDPRPESGQVQALFSWTGGSRIISSDHVVYYNHHKKKIIFFEAGEVWSVYYKTYTAILFSCGWLLTGGASCYCRCWRSLSLLVSVWTN